MQSRENDAFPANASRSFCRSRLPPREPARRRGVCLCFCLPRYSSARLCRPPRRHRCQAAVCGRPSHPAMITFSSLPPSFLPLPHDEPKKPPLHPKCRLLTYLAVSSLIQKTSKQMRSSPVQRCRPAAHASCQETPHTCWLCTFPGKQKQTLDEGGEKKKEEDKKMRPLTMRGIFSLN